MESPSEEAPSSPEARSESKHASAGNAPADARGSALLQALFFALVIRPFTLLALGLRVRGLENLPACGPFILIANHSSHLDTVALLSLFPASRRHTVRPVAAADYFERNAFVAWFSKSFFNILPIARRDITRENDPVRRMLAVLQAGESLILFPEGTRGAANEVGHFRSGVAHLALKAKDVPIVPVFLQNMGRALPKGQFIPLPLFCEIRIAPSLHPRGTKDEIVAQLEEAVRRLIEEA